MHKQNVNKNILSPYAQDNLKTKNSLIQMSFKNLTNKSFCKPQLKCQISPLILKRNKTMKKLDTSINRIQCSDSSLIQYERPNNNLMQAFKMERSSLMNTLNMYKEQIELLNNENAKLKKQSAKNKNQTKIIEDKLAQKTIKNQQLAKKVVEYENILPKIVELETLQENILEENTVLKGKIKMHQALLSNVANLAKMDDQKFPAIDKIKALTYPFLVDKMKQGTKNMRR